LRAVRPPNLRITPDVGAISVTPRVRRVPCSAHLWPSWPTPSRHLVGKRDRGHLGGRAGSHPLCQDPWHQTSALADDIVGGKILAEPASSLAESRCGGPLIFSRPGHPRGRGGARFLLQIILPWNTFIATNFARSDCMARIVHPMHGYPSELGGTASSPPRQLG